MVSHGDLDSTPINPREVYKSAYASQASGNTRDFPIWLRHTAARLRPVIMSSFQHSGTAATSRHRTLQSDGGGKIRSERKPLSTDKVMRHYPRLTAHVIAESLGYATPAYAARILKDAREGRENYCELISFCYGADPLPAVRNAIRSRHYHEGFMADISSRWRSLGAPSKRETSRSSQAAFRTGMGI